MITPISFGFKRTRYRPIGRGFIDISDGDTPNVNYPIRMVSCDTPEKANYAGKPGKSQPKLDECKRRLKGNYYPSIPSNLKTYLINKITPDAAERHINAANKATEELSKLLEKRLQKPNGKKRKLAVIPISPALESNSRLLAYVAPWYTGSASDPVPPKNDPLRRTFNLDMIESGWAAFFPIYPSLPRDDDFNIAIEAAEKAWNNKLGAWSKYGHNLLLAYEFRMCIKLARAKSAGKGMENAFQRICVDLRNRKLVGKFGFCDVPPCYRLWIWEKDLAAAKSDLGL